ncbi:MAG: hypothetical protein J5712_00590 [Lachnospiraceae bacterium]|nr:hypothetical protein [Lachnospiraceae bacterium]MBR5732351.1 hypothetical protein [Lachnospiraceae bacterium]
MLEIRKANNTCRKLFTIITLILFAAYTLELVKGTKTLPMFLILMVLDLGPMIAAHIIYSRNPKSELIKHVVGIGYAVFYTVNCFVSPEQMVFTYAFPMLMVVTVFIDLAFSKLVSIGIAVIAVIHAFVYTSRVGFTNESVAAMEIEIAATVLVVTFNYIANLFIVRMTEEKVKEINEAGAKTSAMLKQISDVAGDMADEVAVVSGKMEQLSASSAETMNSMNEVQSGTLETANSVQTQMVKTEEIQAQIEKVAEASKNIGINAKDTADAISEGRGNIEKLINQAKLSDEAGNGAVKEVEELKSSTDQMETIVQMIQKVASQTSMLALNASIEAARAGEAGRGFAVVASSISDLASQTKSATEEISNLISNLTKEMEDVASAILSLVESNNVQNESAQLTAESFEKIAQNADLITTDSRELSATVSNLESANKKIVDSIQTISAITEEVTAHSQTTTEATEQNQMIVKDVQGVVNEMMKNADKLNALK